MNGDNLSAGFAGVPGSQSEIVQDALDDDDFGAAGEPQVGVVVDPASGATPAQARPPSTGSTRRRRRPTTSS